MNATAPNDWQNFFREGLESTDAHTPIGGITGSGWRLVYNDQPNSLLDAAPVHAEHPICGSWESTGGIVQGVYPPGEPLTEKVLAKIYKGSRTPIREAALRLPAAHCS